MTITLVTPTRREAATNNVALTLNGTINQIALTITVSDGSVLPQNESFRLVIENEILLCDGVTGNDVSVVQRGVEGTTGAIHNDGVDVQVVATPGSLSQILLEAGFYDAGYGATGVPNNRHLDENGNTLTSANWTWVNQGTATVTDSGAGGLYFTLQSATWPDMKCLVRSVPTIPYTMKVKCHFGHGYSTPGVGSSTIIAGWRQSSTGELCVAGIRPDYAAAMWHLDNPTTYNSNVDSAQNGFYGNVPIWLRVRETSTERQVYISRCGNNWSRNSDAFWQESRTNFMTADQLLIGCSSAGGENNEIVHFDSIVIEEE